MAFKVQTTHPSTFFVRPSQGFLKPQGKQAVQVMMHAQNEEAAPHEYHGKPRLRISYVPINKSKFGRDPKITRDLINPDQPGFGEEQRRTTSRQMYGHRSCGTLRISPPDLEFFAEANSTLAAYINVYNLGQKPVAYKVIAPCQRSFQVKPSPAVVQPNCRQAIVVLLKQRSKGPPIATFEQERVQFLAVELPEGVGRQLSVDPSLFNQPVENYGLARLKILPLPPIIKNVPHAEDSAHEMTREASKQLKIDLHNLKLGGDMTEGANEGTD